MERGNLQVAWERATTQGDLVRVEQAMDGLAGSMSGRELLPVVWLPLQWSPMMRVADRV